MKTTAVVYKSGYGSTKRYAEWVAAELDADLFDVSAVTPAKMLSYNTIIYGGGLYASGINGISFLTKNFEVFQSKNIIVFTVGLAATEDKTIFIPIINKNFTAEMQKKIYIFHFRGGIDYKKLGLIHKTMMSMLKATVERKPEEKLTADDRLMLKTFGDQVDFSDRSSIAPLTALVRSFSQ